MIRLCLMFASDGSSLRVESWKVIFFSSLVDEDEPAREALHVVELRTMPQGHADYHFICQEMCRKIQEVNPILAECGKFIDWEKYRLGRLQSEMRTEYKKSGFQ